MQDQTVSECFSSLVQTQPQDGFYILTVEWVYREVTNKVLPCRLVFRGREKKKNKDDLKVELWDGIMIQFKLFVSLNPDWTE